MVGKQRLAVHAPREDRVVERLADRERTPDRAVVDAAGDVVRIEAGRLDRDGVGDDADLLEHVAEPDALPHDGADRAELPGGAGGRRALLAGEEAAPVAGALVDRLDRVRGSRRRSSYDSESASAPVRGVARPSPKTRSRHVSRSMIGVDRVVADEQPRLVGEVPRRVAPSPSASRRWCRSRTNRSAGSGLEDRGVRRERGRREAGRGDEGAAGDGGADKGTAGEARTGRGRHARRYYSESLDFIY